MTLTNSQRNADYSVKKLFSFALLTVFIIVNILSCTQKKYSYSLLKDQETLYQKTTTVRNYVDILWVIDNSATMRSSQENLVKNFNSFIADFKKLDLDFQMAVTTTDSWQDLYDTTSDLSRFKDGTPETSYSGYHILRPSTPNLEENFSINILQGTFGLGNERAFQAIEASLLNPANIDFLREGVHLAIIVISDEDDFSRTSSEWEEDYNLPDLVPMDSFLLKLDRFTGSTPRYRQYDLSAITILDNDCLQKLSKQDSYRGRKIARRYQQAVQATDGVIASLCDSFADRLKFLSNSIIEKATVYPLQREPLPESIVVKVNDRLIPALNSTKSSSGGWSYLANQQAIKFTHPHIPPNGSRIQVTFDPARFD